VSFASITLCVASQRVFIFVSVYFFIDSVRKLLDTPSYLADQRVFQVLILQGKSSVLIDHDGTDVTCLSSRKDYIDCGPSWFSSVLG
jgi:hypothetical protein